MKIINLILNLKKGAKLSIVGFLVSFVLIIFILLKEPKEKLDVKSEETEITGSFSEKESKIIVDLESSKQPKETDIKAETKKKVKKKPPSNLPSKKKLESKKLTKEPNEVVQNLHDGLKSIKTNQIENLDKVINLIQNTYRVDKMLSLIIGKKWGNLSNQKKTQMVNIFTEYISKNYIRRFRTINNPVFTTSEVKDVGKNYKMVRTYLILGNEKVSINYLLSDINGYWRIFDVLLAGSVSEIATKKSEFASFITGNNVEPLIEAITKKNSTLLNE